MHMDDFLEWLLSVYLKNTTGIQKSEDLWHANAKNSLPAQCCDVTNLTNKNLGVLFSYSEYSCGVVGEKQRRVLE